MTVKETGLPGRNRISRDSDSEHCPIESYYLIAIDLGGSRSRRRVFIFVSQWTTERNRIADSLVALATDDLCPTLIIITEGACKCRRYYVIVVCYCPPPLHHFRFVLSLIMANLMSAVVSIPGHVYQLVIKPEQEQQEEVVNNGGGSGGNGGGVTWLEQLDEPDSTLFNSWYWHKQGLDGLTVLVSLASVLSILLISLDRYYVTPPFT